jgi:CRP/FNR family cyclic AMP-dependent transcriptional regulator
MLKDKKYSFLGFVPKEDRRRLTARGEKLTFREKKYLFLKGDPGDNFYIILAGNVIISINSPDGREIILSRLSANDVFGEISMLDQAERTADACVMAGTELLSIGRKAFMDFLDTHPALYKNIIMLLCQRLRTLSEQVESFSLANSLERLVAKLISLAEKIPRGQGATIEISQSDLAKMLGLSREGVNRNLKFLQDKKILRIERQKIFIPDREELQHFQKSMEI